MKIETKFNTNDKVWFLISGKNNYTWGNVESLDISVRCEHIVTITYHITNRFYDREMYCYGIYNKPPFETEQYISLKEDKIYSNPKELLDVFMAESDRKIIELTELKKGWFK